MKEIVAVIFGLGLGCNALLFVPQVLAVWRKKSDEGISLITFGGFSVLHRDRAWQLPTRSLADPRHGGQPADLRIGYGIDYLIQNQTVAGQGR